MKCAIMQPTYLPWSGYFNLIYKTDIFIFLDDTQFSKGSWHNRNRILINSKEKWITVPIKKHKLSTNLDEILIVDQKKWKESHINLIYQAYYKHPFFKNIEELIKFINDIEIKNLSQLNIDLITFISKKLSFKNKFLKSSETKSKKKRTEKLIELLEKYNVAEYFSPKGSRAYLTKDNFVNKTNISLNYQNYETKTYEQNFNKNNIYIDKLSIIDVLANLGWVKTREYIIN